MSEKKNPKPNPMELLLLTGVSLFFCYSVYQTVYDWGFIQSEFASLNNRSNAIREIATRTPVVDSVELGCNSKDDKIKKTNSDKVVLIGSICKIENTVQTDISVMNHATKQRATVTTDSEKGNYFTDELLIHSGTNTIEVNYKLKNGKEFSQKLIIEKN